MATSRAPWMEKPGAFTRIVKILAIAIIVLLMLYPFAYVIFASLTPPGETLRFGLVPSGWTLDAYQIGRASCRERV